MKLKELRNQKILIVGMGLEGKSTAKYLTKNQIEFSTADKNPASKADFSGDEYLKKIKDFDIIIKSAGIPEKIVKGAKKITSQTDIFFSNIKIGIIIGITGSKGKSTTSNAIYQILKEGGKNAVLVGNIGHPALEEIDKNYDYYITELSSYQAESLTSSPHMAVFTSYFPEHLDYHGEENFYKQAKLNVFAYQNSEDFVIIPENFPLKIPTKAQTIEVKKNELSSSTCLLGEHNSQNIALAIEVAKILKIPEEKIKKALENITPLEHRLKKVAEVDGISYYDDAIATNPDATIVALNYFKEKVGTLFLGGSDKGLDFSKLAEKIVFLRIPTLVFIPNNAERIHEALKKISIDYSPQVFFAKNMSEAVNFAHKNTEKGKIALFSTASPSFSLWENYKEQGKDFINCIKELK